MNMQERIDAAIELLGGNTNLQRNGYRSADRRDRLCTLLRELQRCIGIEGEEEDRLADAMQKALDPRGEDHDDSYWLRKAKEVLEELLR